MLANEIIEEDKEIRPIQSRMVRLSTILEKLTRSGDFQQSILSDEKGMVISEFGERILNKETVGAMFALMQNVVNRTTKNLNLEDLEVLILQTTNEKVFSTSFCLDHYDRHLILTGFSKTRAPTKPINNESEKPQLDKNSQSTSQKHSKYRNSFGKIIKKITRSMIRGLKFIDNKIIINKTVHAPLSSKSSNLTDIRTKSLTEAIKEFKEVL